MQVETPRSEGATASDTSEFLLVEERSVAAKRRWDKTLPHWFNPETGTVDMARTAATAVSSSEDPATLRRAAEALRRQHEKERQTAEEMSDDEDNAQEPPKDEGGLSHVEKAAIA